MSSSRERYVPPACEAASRSSPSPRCRDDGAARVTHPPLRQPAVGHTVGRQVERRGRRARGRPPRRAGGHAVVVALPRPEPAQTDLVSGGGVGVALLVVQGGRRAAVLDAAVRPATRAPLHGCGAIRQRDGAHARDARGLRQPGGHREGGRRAVGRRLDGVAAELVTRAHPVAVRGAGLQLRKLEPVLAGRFGDDDLLVERVGALAPADLRRRRLTGVPGERRRARLGGRGAERRDRRAGGGRRPVARRVGPGGREERVLEPLDRLRRDSSPGCRCASARTTGRPRTPSGPSRSARSHPSPPSRRISACRRCRRGS